jgi:hypothetical protein
VISICLGKKSKAKKKTDEKKSVVPSKKGSEVPHTLYHLPQEEVLLLPQYTITTYVPKDDSEEATGDLGLDDDFRSSFLSRTSCRSF